MIKPINIIIVEQIESFKMFLYQSYNIKVFQLIFLFIFNSNHVSTCGLNMI